MISLDRAQSARNATDVSSICSKTRDRKDNDSEYMPLVQSGLFRVLSFECSQFQLVHYRDYPRNSTFISSKFDNLHYLTYPRMYQFS